MAGRRPKSRERDSPASINIPLTLFLRGWRAPCRPPPERSGLGARAGRWRTTGLVRIGGLLAARAARCFPPAPGRRPGGAGVPARRREAVGRWNCDERSRPRDRREGGGATGARPARGRPTWLRRIEGAKRERVESRRSVELRSAFVVAKRWDVGSLGGVRLPRASSQRDSPASINIPLTLFLRGWRDGCGRRGWDLLLPAAGPRSPRCEAQRAAGACGGGGFETRQLFSELFFAR